MAGVDCLENIAHFLVHRLAEGFARELQAGLDQAGVFFDREVGVLVLVIDNPALALGDDFVPKLRGGELVSPLAEMRLR